MAEKLTKKNLTEIKDKLLAEKASLEKEKE